MKSRENTILMTFSYSDTGIVYWVVLL